MLDLRKRPIRGLWERNGRYCAQMTVADPVSGIKQVKRVPLENVTPAAQARDKFQDLLAQRRKGVLPVLKRTPLFADYAARHYFAHYDQVKDAKRASTLYTEKLIIKHWNEHPGHE